MVFYIGKKRRPPRAKRTYKLFTYTRLCRSLESHALWQFGARDPFHCCKRLPRAEARRGAAANIGRWKAVIVDDAVRSGARRGGDQSREREDRKSTRLNSSH